MHSRVVLLVMCDQALFIFRLIEKQARLARGLCWRRLQLGYALLTLTMASMTHPLEVENWPFGQPCPNWALPISLPFQRPVFFHGCADVLAA